MVECPFFIYFFGTNYFVRKKSVEGNEEKREPGMSLGGQKLQRRDAVSKTPPLHNQASASEHRDKILKL